MAFQHILVQLIILVLDLVQLAVQPLAPPLVDHLGNPLHVLVVELEQFDIQSVELFGLGIAIGAIKSSLEVL